MNEKTKLEQAPPNSLPDWRECQRILDNHDFRQRAAMGLEGSDLDTPPTTPEPTELHRFIYEYDDADPYRSAWFMHRLELVLNEARAASPSSKSTKEADKLHAAIMNLPANRANSYRTTAERFAYAAGHRDARHAAAGLALASSSIKEDGERAEPVAPLPYTDAIGRAGQEYHRQFEHAHPLPALWRWQELWDRMVAASSPPSPLGDTPDQQEQKR